MNTTATAVDSKVKQVVSTIRNLPTPPIVFHQIQKVINSPTASAAQVASILSEDPAMSVKVLKLTNSAFYGLSREIESVKQAVVIIGMEAVKNLVLSASVLEMFKGHNVDTEFQEAFWRHSLASAFCSRILARKLRHRGVVDPDAAFSAGLLLHIGQLVLCCFVADDFTRYRQAHADNPELSVYDCEEQTLGYNHAQVGTLLAQQWKLPSKLINAIEFHHRPFDGPNDEPMPTLVHLADKTAAKAFPSDSAAFPTSDVAPEILAFWNLDASDLDSFEEFLNEEYVKAETFMKMAGVA